MILLEGPLDDYLLNGNHPVFVDLAKVVSVILAGHGGLLFLHPRIDGELLCIKIMLLPCF